MEAEDERTEVVSLARCIAADDKFLFSDYLDLKPVAAALGLISARGALCHDALEASSAGRGEHFFAIVDEVFGVAHHCAWCKDRGERALPLNERHVAQIEAIEVQQVEYKQCDGCAARQVRDGVGIGNPDSGLNQAEAGDAILVERGDFAIQHRLLCRNLMPDHT